MIKKIFYMVQDFFDRILEPYEMSNYDIRVRDEISGEKYAVSDWIKSLDERIQYLEDELIWSKSEIRRLSEENIETTNSLYEISNSIEARIDILGSEIYNTINSKQNPIK